MAQELDIRTRGRLRIDFRDRWFVQDLGTWLDRFARAYDRINAADYEASVGNTDVFEFVVRRTQRELSTARAVRADAADIAGHVDLSFAPVVAQVRRQTGELELSSIHIASPAWLDVIGRLNPLRAISDVIETKMRETTKREDIQSRERTEATRSRERVSIALVENIDKFPPEVRPLISGWITQSWDEPTVALMRLTTRALVTNVTLATLPPPGQGTAE
jgi:hypothetical protein